MKVFLQSLFVLVAEFVVAALETVVIANRNDIRKKCERSV